MTSLLSVHHQITSVGQKDYEMHDAGGALMLGCFYGVLKGILRAELPEALEFEVKTLRI